MMLSITLFTSFKHAGKDMDYFTQAYLNNGSSIRLKRHR